MASYLITFRKVSSSAWSNRTFGIVNMCPLLVPAVLSFAQSLRVKVTCGNTSANASRLRRIASKVFTEFKCERRRIGSCYEEF